MALRFSIWWTLFLALTLTACGSLPAGVQRQESHSLQASPAESPLAQLAATQLPADAQSGFRLLPLGSYALDARLALIERATRTLDVQYYVMDNDASGRAVFAALRDAAGRGVRVRLLLDDMNTTRAEPLIEALSDVPNLEIRLFNPFCCARSSLAGRVATSLGDLPRLDHRMHNKLLIADGALAIVGGRNVADEYFARNPVANFIDLDAIAAGRVVPQLGVLFDRYWNSEESFPATYFSARASRRARATRCCRSCFRRARRRSTSIFRTRISSTSSRSARNSGKSGSRWYRDWHMRWRIAPRNGWRRPMRSRTPASCPAR